MTSGFFKNFFALPTSSAGMLAAIVTSRTRENNDQPTRRTKRLSRVMGFSSFPWWNVGATIYERGRERQSQLSEWCEALIPSLRRAITYLPDRVSRVAAG